MPMRKLKPHDPDDAVETPVELSIDEPKQSAPPPKIDASLQSLTPAEINQAVAALVGVPVTTRQSPVGVLCFKGNGALFSPVDIVDHASFAARRYGFDDTERMQPRDICLTLLTLAGKGK